MAVPLKPAAGGVVESAWGGIVHDEVVAQEIQAGVATIALNNQNSASLQVNFPHPFAAPPVVVVTVAANSTTLVAGIGVPSASGVGIYLFRKDEASTTAAGVAVHWFAYGPRA
jgi:hypothetical protein